MSRWEGPFTITQQISPLLYRLDFKATALKSNVVHIQRIKRFHDREQLLGQFYSKVNSFILKRFKSTKPLEMRKEPKRSDSGTQDSPQQPLSNAQNVQFCPDCISSDSDSDTDVESEFNWSVSTGSDDEFHISDSDVEITEPAIEPEPNFNVDPNLGLRRSTRVRNAPDRLQLLTTALLCLCCFTTIDSLSNVEPIIWQKVNNPVVVGVDYVTVSVNYKSPCYLFNEFFDRHRCCQRIENLV